MLELLNITKSFGKREILAGVNLELKKEKVYSLLGINGSGKTTLFNIITGFSEAKSGTMLFKGKKINGLSPIAINRLGITRTFQNLRLIEGLTVKENVLLAFKKNKGEIIWNSLLPGIFFKKYFNDFEGRADEIIKNIFLEKVTNHKAGEISCGEQKLLTLGCCLANNADLLLLDEPVTGINKKYIDKIIELVKNIKKSKKTILVIEHNTNFIKKVSDQIFFLSDGIIILYDDYNKFRSSKSVQQAYL